jgi:rhodanese-related sulfurtransferase
MVPEIDPPQVARMHAAAAVAVVQVREADGYRAGHAPGTAAWTQGGRPVEHGTATGATR